MDYYYCYEKDHAYASSFKRFGVVSNESLRVGVVRNDSLRGGSGREARNSSPSSGAGGRDRKKKKKKKQQQQQQEEQGCSGISSNSSRRMGQGATQNRKRGWVVLFATPQELGDRCVKFIKEQRSRIHIIRRCAVMLAWWPKYR